MLKYLSFTPCIVLFLFDYLFRFPPSLLIPSLKNCSSFLFLKKFPSIFRSSVTVSLP